MCAWCADREVVMVFFFVNPSETFSRSCGVSEGLTKKKTIQGKPQNHT